MREGERQVAPTLDGIRKDHVERYRWAAGLVKGQFVLDVACGVGYGASLLADAGASVSAFDQEQEAIDFARAHYARNAVCYRRWDIDHLLRADYNSPLHGGARFGEHVDAAIAFEIIEHLEDPRSMLRDLHKITGTLLASVPNERVFPFRSLATLRGERVGSPRTVRFHHRHYTLDEFADLLAETGWTVEEWLGQVGPHDPVEPGVEGRTIVVRARRRIAGDELLRGRVDLEVASAAGFSPRDEDRVATALAAVGLDAALAKRRIDQLSGGQMRRVVLAGLLARSPRALILDEPLAGLDAASQRGLLRLLEDLRRDRGLTVVVISHDFVGLEELCPRVLQLSNGVLEPASATADGVS